MSDRKSKSNAPKAPRAKAPAVIEVAAGQAEPLPATELTVEALAAPCATEAAAVEVVELQAATPVEVELPARTEAERLATPAEAPVVPTAAASAAAAETIQSIVAKGTSTMNDQINQTIEANKAATQEAANRVQAAFGDINERSKTAMEKSAKLMEEMTDIARGNVEAFVASSKVAARGAETLTQEAADFSRRSFEATSNAMKSFAEVKSPTDFFRLQSEFARGQFDAMVSETSKMSEAVIKLTGEIAEPITSRYSVAAERVKTIAL